MGATKGVGEKAIETIVSAREEGPFHSLGDFCSRTASSGQVNKRIVEGLIKAGAFDGLGVERARLVAGVEGAIAWAQRVSEDRAAGQMGLFALDGSSSSPQPDYPDVTAWDAATRLEAEHDVVGFYISGHPLDRYLDDLDFLSVTPTSRIDVRMDDQTVRLAGVVNTIKLKNSKKGERYATFNLEDRDGILEVIAWPDTYKRCEAALAGREPVLVTGRVEFGERRAAGVAAVSSEGEDAGPGFSLRPQLIAEEIVTLCDARRKQARIVDLELRSGEIDESRLAKLRTTLLRHPGRCRPYLKIVRSGATETLIELPADLNIDPTDNFLRDVEDVLGPGAASIR